MEQSTENQKIGLVFSGGGLKGGYEIGVWKALLEKGVAQKITAVSGTSVGALNSMLFAKGDYAAAENLWLGVTRGDLLYLPETEKAGRLARTLLEAPDTDSLMERFAAGAAIPAAVQQLFGETVAELDDAGVFSTDRLLALIRGQITPAQAAALPIETYVTCSRIVSKSYLLGREGGTVSETFEVRSRAAEVEQLLLASAAIPVVYPPVRIGGADYVDGGFTPGGNTPVMPLYARGYRRIIVVYLQKKTEARIRKRDYPFAEFAEIIPGDELDTGPLAAVRMPAEGFASEIEAGYRDAMGTCTFV